MGCNEKNKILTVIKGKLAQPFMEKEETKGEEKRMQDNSRVAAIIAYIFFFENKNLGRLSKSHTFT